MAEPVPFSPRLTTAFDPFFCARLFAISVSIRVLFLLVIFLVAHDSAGSFFSQSDAGSYLAVARRIYLGGEGGAGMTEYDSRVFPGWPLLFGWTFFLGLGDAGILIVALLLAGGVPCLFYCLTGDKPLSLLLCFFPPAWLLQSIYPMGEAAYLFLGLLSIGLLLRGKPSLAGFAIGMMFAVRPYAAVLALGEMWILFRRKEGGRWRDLVGYGTAAALAPLLCAGLNHAIYGDILRQVHMYGKSLADLNVSDDIARRLGNPSGHLGPPFWNVIITPWKVPTPAWKTLYIYAHAALLLFVSGVAIRRLLGSRKLDELDVCMHAWFLGNAILIVSSGPYWGFHSFDRYFLWAWPAALWIARDCFRFRLPAQAFLFVVSVGMTAFALGRRFLLP